MCRQVGEIDEAIEGSPARGEGGARFRGQRHPFVDLVFKDPGVYDAVTQRWAVLAYAAQIYCDFSGYSDLALGCAKWFGFELPQNFDFPYLAANIAEFWKRWHISLSTWMRDYLYIAMGGSRGSTLRSRSSGCTLRSSSGSRSGRRSRSQAATR